MREREKEPVFRPVYWADRLQKCGGEIHRAIFNGSIDQFSPIHQKHRVKLLEEIKPHDSILDAGCGYGRILDAMPDEWNGLYLGVDICPQFIHLGKLLHPQGNFIVGDLRQLWSVLRSQGISTTFDVAIVASVKNMVIRNMGQAEWDKIEYQLRLAARRILYLEYDKWD